MKKEKKVVEKIPCEEMEGKTVPKLTLKDADGNDVQLACGKGDNYLVLAFYPVDHLKWEIEFIKTFEAKKAEFEKVGAKILMVCTDPVEKHKQFKTKQGFTVPLISDSDKKLIDELGTKNPTGRYLRHIMVCDTKNKCVKHYKDLAVKDNNAEPVIEWIKSQKKK
eukprot:Mrub_10034.p2 GENE.Mrub_10034~~Mrub_10034.p2  ORF type:complete len:183 (+),score=54.99 Mrub_10034:57-551(+)